MRIVTDSSANIVDYKDMNLGVAPLHIIVGDMDYVDDDMVDIDAMQKKLSSYKGKTSTASPSPEEWERAFGNDDIIFCITITSGLSGTYNSALAAKGKYESEHKGSRVFIIDSLSTGPEIELIAEKAQKLIGTGASPDEIYNRLIEYKEKTHLYFSLASVKNFAKNGRINPVVATGIDFLGIKIVGKASEEGTLLPMDKCRGEKKALNKLVNHLKKCGYKNGKIIIAHNNNETGAEELSKLIEDEFGLFNGKINKTRALCSYYAEPGSILIGFEA